jgi:hypothetical protein
MILERILREQLPNPVENRVDDPPRISEILHLRVRLQSLAKKNGPEA